MMNHLADMEVVHDVLAMKYTLTMRRNPMTDKRRKIIEKINNLTVGFAFFLRMISAKQIQIMNIWRSI